MGRSLKVLNGAQNSIGLNVLTRFCWDKLELLHGASFCEMVTADRLRTAGNHCMSEELEVLKEVALRLEKSAIPF